MAIPRFRAADTALLVVDVQEKLLPHIHEHERVTGQVGRLIDIAKVLEIPILVTEQYRKGLGVTVEPLAGSLADAVGNFEKTAFSACVEPVRDQLARRAVRSVLVCGIEAHVCVLQTCLDLADNGYIVAVATDAIGSRRAIDQQAAEQRLIGARIIPSTVESAVLELVGEAGSDRFKAVLPIIK